MIKTLSAGAIGVRTHNLDDAIAAAVTGGFEGLEFSIDEVANLGAEVAKQKFAEAGIVPAVFGVPVDWRGDESAWRESLRGLPRLAKAAADLGCLRCATWIMPGDNEKDFEQNTQFHVERFRPIAEGLAEYGISVGLEFVGPKTLRSQFVHEFVCDAQGMLELGHRIGPNVGLLLDSFHWFTCHGTVEDLCTLKAEQIVYVHINDAVAGRDIDEQLDGDRRLPGATGVIDISAFLKTLTEIGYPGPVAVEPFFPPLNDLPSDEERLATVKTSIDRVFEQAGLV